MSEWGGTVMAWASGDGNEGVAANEEACFRCWGSAWANGCGSGLSSGAVVVVVTRSEGDVDGFCGGDSVVLVDAEEP